MYRVIGYTIPANPPIKFKIDSNVAIIPAYVANLPIRLTYKAALLYFKITVLIDRPFIAVNK